MKNDFGKKYRLLKADEYSSVFAFRKRRNSVYFQVFRCPCSLGHPRLGLIVAKKVAKKAHERNYIKRAIREWFRVNKPLLGNFDYVVRSQKKFEKDALLEALSSLQSAFMGNR